MTRNGCATQQCTSVTRVICLQGGCTCTCEMWAKPCEKCLTEAHHTPVSSTRDRPSVCKICTFATKFAFIFPGGSHVLISVLLTGMPTHFYSCKWVDKSQSQNHNFVSRGFWGWISWGPGAFLCGACMFWVQFLRFSYPKLLGVFLNQQGQFDFASGQILCFSPIGSSEQLWNDKCYSGSPHNWRHTFCWRHWDQVSQIKSWLADARGPRELCHQLPAVLIITDSVDNKA